MSQHDETPWEAEMRERGMRELRGALEADWRRISSSIFTIALRTRDGCIRDDIQWKGAPPFIFRLPCLGDMVGYSPCASAEPLTMTVRDYELERVNYDVKIAFYRERMP